MFFLKKAVEKVRVRLWVSLFWRRPSTALSKAMIRFEATEDDSAWQLLRAAELAPLASQRASLFAQAMEETRHAEEFREAYRRIFQRKMRRRFEEKRPIYEEKADLARLFIFCQIGERSAAGRFEEIVKARPHPELEKVLARIVVDEKGHIGAADRMVAEIAQELKLSPEFVRSIHRKILWQRASEGWMRMGRHITALLADLLLSAVYFGPMAFYRGIALRRLRGIDGREAHGAPPVASRAQETHL